VGAFLVAAGGGAVRLLPWLLHPEVPLGVALPFARSLGLAALEIALLVGWPVGWALAAQERAERGEVRVLALLGEGPWASLGRVWLPALAFAATLAGAAWLGARDAAAPGRVAQDLVDEAHADCARQEHATVRAVPFVGMTWLCVPSQPPRVLAQGVHGATFTATGLHLAPDLRSAELDDATFAVRGATVRATRLSLRGLPPFGASARLDPTSRALVLGGSGLAAAASALLLVLRGRARTRLRALALGAAGPLAALGMLRALERAAAPVPFFAAVPVGVVLAVLASGILVSRLRRRNPAVRTES
jgi:hypothetical protein